MMIRATILGIAAMGLSACYPASYRDTGVTYQPAPEYSRSNAPSYYDSDDRDYGYQDTRYRESGRYSDRSIHDRVHHILEQDPYIRTQGIQVHVQDGVVTLTGYVARRSQARRAHDLAHSVRGVHSVFNRLSVL